ncbi:unnamed protein product [Peniophora sp. CBMAI 1063]|nr:unnamed protein product [Peniophora sp. CBMAI 1063]
MSKASQRDVSGAPSASTAASLLGLKDVIVRPHGLQQKPHVILRPLELDDDSLIDGDAPRDPSMLYFSLFAAKRIECKPGKEILVALEDSPFGDRPIVFGGEMLDAEADSDDEVAVEEAMRESTPTLEAAMPPKMRKKWGRGEDITSSPPMQEAPVSTVPNVPQKTYCEMGTQTDMVVIVHASDNAAPAPAQSLTAFNPFHVESFVPSSSPPGYVGDPDALALNASAPGEKLVEAMEADMNGKARSVHLAAEDKVRAHSTPMELDSPGASALSLPKTLNAATEENDDVVDTRPDDEFGSSSSRAASTVAAAPSGQERSVSEIAQSEPAPVDVPMAEVEEATKSQDTPLLSPAEDSDYVPGLSEPDPPAVEGSSGFASSTTPVADASASPQVPAQEAAQSGDTHKPKLESPAPEAPNANTASPSLQDTVESVVPKSEAATPSPSFTMPSPSALRAFLPDAVSRLLPLIGTPGAESQSPVSSSMPPENYLPVPSPPPSEPTPPPQFTPESPAPSNSSAPTASFSQYQASTSRPQSARSPAPSNASNSTAQFVPRTSCSRSPVVASRPLTMSDANATPVGGDSGWASRRNSQQYPPSRRQSGSFNSPTRSGSFDGGPSTFAPNSRFQQRGPPPPRSSFNNNFGGPPRGRSPPYDRFKGSGPNGPPSYRDGPPGPDMHGPPMNQGFGGPSGPPGRGGFGGPTPNGGWDEPPPPRNGPPFPPQGRNGPPGGGPPFPPNGMGRGGPAPYNDGPGGPGPYSPHDMGPPFPPQGDMGGRNGPYAPGPPGRRNGPSGGPPFPPNDMGPRNGPPFPPNDMPPPRNNSFPPPGARSGTGPFPGPPINGPPRNGRFNGPPPPNELPPFPPNAPGPGFNGPPPFSPHDGPPSRFGGPNNVAPPSPVDGGRFGPGPYGPPRGTGPPPPHDGGRFPSGGGRYTPEDARYPPDPYGPPPPVNNSFSGPPPPGPPGPYGGPPPSSEPYNDGYGGPPPTSTALSAMLAQLAEATAATRQQDGPPPPFPPGPPGPPGFQGPPGPPGPPPMMGGPPPPSMPPPNTRRQGSGPGNNKRFNNNRRDRSDVQHRPPSPNYGGGGGGNARFDSPTGSLKRKASAMSEPELPPPPPENMSVAPAAAAPALPVVAARPAPSGYSWPTTAPLRATALPGGIKSLSLSSDGGLIALLGGGADADTVSIWDNSTCAEVARLAHASPVAEVAWGSEDAAVGDALAALCEGGAVFRWTRPLTGGPWACERVSDAPSGAQDQPTALAHAHGRVAAAFAKYGVRIWVRGERGWTAQRSVLRQNVSAVKFVEEGSALLGGTRDGVLWYCQVQGLMRACAFFKSEVRDIDISANGQHALVSQADGCAALVRIEDDNRGQVERLFTIKDASLGATFGPNARLAPGLILWGAAQGFVLVWDFQQPQIIRAMDVGEGAEPVALALCRTPRSGISSALVVGTADGRLTWWAPPEDAQGEPNHKRIKTELPTDTALGIGRCRPGELVLFVCRFRVANLLPTQPFDSPSARSSFVCFPPLLRGDTRPSAPSVGRLSPCPLHPPEPPAFLVLIARNADNQVRGCGRRCRRKDLSPHLLYDQQIPERICANRVR